MEKVLKYESEKKWRVNLKKFHFLSFLFTFYFLVLCFFRFDVYYFFCRDNLRIARNCSDLIKYGKNVNCTNGAYNRYDIIHDCY